MRCFTVPRTLAVLGTLSGLLYAVTAMPLMLIPLVSISGGAMPRYLAVFPCSSGLPRRHVAGSSPVPGERAASGSAVDDDAVR
jgi:hypothetical protein